MVLTWTYITSDSVPQPYLDCYCCLSTTVYRFFIDVIWSSNFIRLLKNITYLVSKTFQTTYVYPFTFCPQPNELTQHAVVENRAFKFISEVQQLNTDELEGRGVDNTHVSRRKTIFNLERRRTAKQNVVNLESNFEKRLSTVIQNPGEAFRSAPCWFNSFSWIVFKRNNLFFRIFCGLFVSSSTYF